MCRRFCPFRAHNDISQTKFTIIGLNRPRRLFLFVAWLSVFLIPPIPCLIAENIAISAVCALCSPLAVYKPGSSSSCRLQLRVHIDGLILVGISSWRGRPRRVWHRSIAIHVYLLNRHQSDSANVQRCAFSSTTNQLSEVILLPSAILFQGPVLLHFAMFGTPQYLMRIRQYPWRTGAPQIKAIWHAIDVSAQSIDTAERRCPAGQRRPSLNMQAH
jgi:hypothetical protein